MKLFLTIILLLSANSLVAQAPRYTVTDLGTLGDKNESSEASSINDKGEVVGSVVTKHLTLPFVFRAGVVTMLQVPQKYSGGRAYAINNHDEIVGNADIYLHISFKQFQQNPTNESINASHAAAWINGKMYDLGTLANNLSAAADVNDRGQIVGYSEGRDWDNRHYPRQHAVLWQDMTIYDLNACIPVSSQWQLSFASAINNKGQIVGNGIHNGHTRAYLLTPITK